MRLASGWAVLAAGERLHSSNEAGHELYKIERLEARPCVVKRKLIAVLDDDPDLTNSICDFLRAEGYDAKPFYASADLVADSSRRQFEAFVIDWVIGEEMALKLIKGLRERDAAVPIIVLTAHVSTGEVDEADIAQAVKAFGLVFFEKPVRTAILAATIAQAMAMAEQGRA